MAPKAKQIRIHRPMRGQSAPARLRSVLREIVQFRLLTQPDEMIAVRHDGAKVSAASLGGLSANSTLNLRLVTRIKSRARPSRNCGW